MSRRIRPLLRALESRVVPTTFIVTNAADSGAGSLRQAVMDANGLAGADSIVFDATEFSTQKTVTLTSGSLLLTDSTTINGPLSGVKVSGNDASRVFDLQSAGTSTFTLTRLVITGGKPESQSGGGARLTGNSKLTLSECTVAGNTSIIGGGGISVVGTGASLVLDNSTVSGNQAGDGGGIYIFSGNNTITVRNSTISDNSASDDGGGIAFFTTGSGQLNVLNSTITGNSATDAGGGLSLFDYGPQVTLQSTVVSGNFAASGPDIRQVGLAVQANNSAIGSSLGFNLQDQGGNLPYGTDLKLGPLADNGGRTLTHLPAVDSPLVNKGVNPAAINADQRGAGYPRILGGTIDIGAVEVFDSVVRNINNTGAGSLRNVIGEANSVTGANTITFSPLVFNSAKTITLTTGSILITQPLTITGPGSGLLTVSGNNSDRVFNASVLSKTASLTVSGMTIAAGQTNTIGAGMFVGDTSLTLIDCAFVGNDADGNGGGLWMQAPNGALIITDCTFADNTSGADGGGLWFNLGALTISNCTISGNLAGDAGGGAYIGAPSGSPTVRNSTVSGNTAAGTGGGLYLFNSTSTLAVLNSTVTGNKSNAGSGGGIACTSGSGSIDLTSSIVSGNSNTTAPDISSSGKVYANYCAIGDAKGFTLSGANNLAFGADLKLGPLADNGGPTPTHALLSGSMAIDAGSNPLTLATDQRGPGFARTVNGKTDIGAYELQQQAPRVASVVVNDGATQRARVTQITVNFDQVVVTPGGGDAFQLLRQGDGAKVALVANITNDTTTHVTLTFTGATAVDFGSLADGRYTLTILAPTVSGPGGSLDGNGDGTPGDNYVLVGDPATAPKLYRLFGDSDGDNDVDATDFAAFRGSFGGSSTIFDFDNDGDVDTSDFGQFRGRFGAEA